MTQPYPHTIGTLRDDQWIKKLPSEYSPVQIAQYLSVVGYEPQLTPDDISSGGFPVNLENLERIMRLHLLTFSFENTAMHYTADHLMDVTLEGVFHRLVNQRKGSYCFGQNGLFLQILRGLGFRAYNVSGRVNISSAGQPPTYGPSGHLAILAQPFPTSNQTYLVDVGFGSSCITHPLLLSTDPNNVVGGISETERHRLTRTPPSRSSLSSSSELSSTTCDQWNLELWHKKSNPSDENWYLLYSFIESEYWLPDIEYASFAISTRYSPTSVLHNNILCVKMFTLDEGNDHLEKSRRPTYRITLSGDEVRQHVDSETRVLRKLKTELDRINALREIFGIDVKDEDAVHIVGRKSAFVLP